MGNTFLLRLKAIPAITVYLKQFEDVYEHQKQKNKIFKLIFDLCEFWFLVVRFVISPLCSKFEARVFSFDDFACKCLDHVQPALNSATFQNLLRIISDRFHDIRLFRSISLPATLAFCRQTFIITLRHVMKIGRRDNLYHLVTSPKRFMNTACTYATEHLNLLEVAWIVSISNFIACLPHSINLPYRDLMKMVPWLCASNKSEMVIGYVPFHPDDLYRLWQNRLFIEKNGACWPSYATR